MNLVDRIYQQVQPYTMVPMRAVAFTIESTISTIKAGIPGHIVECGVWKGGCALAMLLAQREELGKVQRTVHLLDSFEGLPPATERDGPAAQAWQKDTKAPHYYNNCKANMGDVQALLEHHGFHQGDYRIWPGWFAQTVPLIASILHDAGDPAGGIALLRLDGDWYRSTEVCLYHLVPICNKHAMILIDDYYAWDGCARAVHEHLTLTNKPYRIKTIDYFMGAYFIKE